MSKLKETNDLIKDYEEDSFCLLDTQENILFDIAKSLAIIADKLNESEDKE